MRILRLKWIGLLLLTAYQCCSALQFRLLQQVSDGNGQIQVTVDGSNSPPTNGIPRPTLQNNPTTPVRGPSISTPIVDVVPPLIQTIVDNRKPTSQPTNPVVPPNNSQQPGNVIIGIGGDVAPTTNQQNKTDIINNRPDVSNTTKLRAPTLDQISAVVNKIDSINTQILSAIIDQRAKLSRSICPS